MFVADEPAHFECSLDGGEFSPCSSAKSYLGSTASPNPHVFQVRAIDLSGNIDPTPASYSWQVDPNALDTTVTASPPPTSGPNVAFMFTATRPGRFECKLSPLEAAFSTCSSPKTYNNLQDTNNPFTFAVRAIDAADNVDDSPATYQWIVDSTGPVVSIIPLPSDTSEPTDVVKFDSEIGATFECRPDHGNYVTCPGTGYSFAQLPVGMHTLEIRAADQLANVGPTASYAWTVQGRIDVTVYVPWAASQSGHLVVFHGQDGIPVGQVTTGPDGKVHHWLPTSGYVTAAPQGSDILYSMAGAQPGDSLVFGYFASLPYPFPFPTGTVRMILSPL
jgi:hypothetical protein